MQSFVILSTDAEDSNFVAFGWCDCPRIRPGSDVPFLDIYRLSIAHSVSTPPSVNPTFQQQEVIITAT